MVKVDNKIAVVRRDGIIERQCANFPPVFKSTALEDRRPLRRTLIGYFDVKLQGAFWLWIAFIKNLRHDFIAKIHRFPGNARLVRRHQ